MGAKRKAQKRAATQGNNNVIEFNTFSKKQTVQLLPIPPCGFRSINFMKEGVRFLRCLEYLNEKV